MGAGESKAISKETMDTLKRQFLQLAGKEGVVTAMDLQQLPELAGNPMMPRILHVMDANGDGRLTLEEFLEALQWIGDSSSDIQGRLKLAFKCFDPDDSGAVTAQELYSVLHFLVGDSYTAKQLEHVVTATMLKYDSDGDYTLTLQEFSQLMAEQELYSKFTLPFR